jgi:hypothetical protein
MGLSSGPYTGRVEQRKKPQPTFCVSTKLSLHSDIHTYKGSYLLEPEDVKESKSGGHLEFYYRNRTTLTWHQIVGHKGHF